MAEAGERVRVTQQGWAYNKVAEVVEANPRYCELKMMDGSRMLFPAWAIEQLGSRDPVRSSVNRRMRLFKEHGGAL